MNNKDLYKQAFSTLHASEKIVLEEKMEEKKRIVPIRKFVTACACCILVLSLGICAYASGIVKEIFGWNNNYRVEVGVDEEGEEYSEAVLFTDNMTEPVEIKDDRMIFIVNNEEIDITDLVSATETYLYEYEDEEGNTHLFAVGLLGGAARDAAVDEMDTDGIKVGNDAAEEYNSDDISNYGYAEYIKDKDGNWIGGYSARINIEPDGSTSAEWLNVLKTEYNIPF